MADNDQPATNDNGAGCHYHQYYNSIEHHYEIAIHDCPQRSFHNIINTAHECHPHDDHTRFDNFGFYRPDLSHADHGLDAGLVNCAGC